MRRICIAATILTLAACSGGDSVAPPPPPPPPPVPPPVLTVVAPTTAMIVGDTATATSSLPAPTWTSSTPSVATISAGGIIQAVAAGVDTIRAVSGRSAGFAVITVAAPPVLPAGVVRLSLNVGTSKSFVPSENSAGFVAPRGSDYVFIAAKADVSADSVGKYAMRVDDYSTSANVVVAPSGVRNVPTRGAPASFGVLAESRLRSFERTYLAPKNRTALARLRADRASNATGRGVSANMNIGSGIQVGDQRSMNVPLLGNACANYATVTAQVVAVGTHAVIMADTAAPANGFATADYTQIATEFDNIIYPTDTTYFGAPTDLDANGRVVLLFTPQINKLTPAGANGYLGGFFFAGDLYAASDCGGSNGGEIFYLLAPDPTGVDGLKHSVTDIKQATRGTVAHEFQHMINAGHRLALGTGFEEQWLDEGLAHTSEDLVGRAEDNYGLLDRLNATSILTNSVNYSAFYFQNVARFAQWAKAPGQGGVNSNQVDTSLAVRGAVWSLLRRAVDFHGQEGLLRGLLAGNARGINNLTTHANTNWSTLVDEWLVANVADGLGSNAEGYKSYDIRSVEGTVSSGGAYPLAITTLAGHDSVSGQVVSNTGNYYIVHGNGSTVVKMTTPDGTAPASFTGIQLLVVRVK